MKFDNKIVEFDKYCNTCLYEKRSAILDPCHECLQNPTNVNSRIPVKYEKNKLNK